MTRRFKANPHLERDLQREQAQQLDNALREAAEPARARADQLARHADAPWMPKPGSARQAVVLERGTGGIRIVLRGYGAHLIEWGSRNNPPHAPLRRGVRAAGLRLDEK